MEDAVEPADVPGSNVVVSEQTEATPDNFELSQNHDKYSAFMTGKLFKK